MKTLCRDPSLTIEIGQARPIQAGVQPFVYVARGGLLWLQAQLAEEALHSRDRMTFHWRLGSSVSRDCGATWIRVDQWQQSDEPLFEGGCVQLADGQILMLDSYITPGETRDRGVGELWSSRDGWQRVSGPEPMSFHIPEVNFDASRDDGGHPHRALRLHRSVLQLPTGELLATAYGWLHGDDTSCEYQPKMKKARTMLFRSSDLGQTWELVTTVAVGPVGTEGFVEPVLLRLDDAADEGRLLCLMRTGRELYGSYSDDCGEHWATPAPVAFPTIDLRDTAAWAAAFDGASQPVELLGAAVDPDLVQLRNGVVACAFGVRIPEKACFAQPGYVRNGNYLAFSHDGGRSWSHLIQLTSGLLTTHYMSVCETRSNQMFVAWDQGKWGQPEAQVYGCTISCERR